jgi:hypothetical protein
LTFTPDSTPSTIWQVTGAVTTPRS